MNKIKIIPNDTGRGYRLFVNDVDVSASTHEADVKLSLVGGKLAELTIKVRGVVEVESIKAVVNVESEEDGTDNPG